MVDAGLALVKGQFGRLEPLREPSLLQSNQLSYSLGPHGQHGVELLLTEGGFLRRALNLDESPRSGHHYVHVHFGDGVLGVAEIQEDALLHDAHADGCDRIQQGVLLDLALVPEQSHAIRQGHKAGGDRSGPRPAIGLDHIAVDDDRSLTQPPRVRYTSWLSADDALDLRGAATHAPRRDLPGTARGRGAGG